MEREGGLGWAWSAAFRADLCPAFTEEVAEVPTCLDGRSEKFFVGSTAFTAGLAEVEKHFCK